MKQLTDTQYTQMVFRSEDIEKQVLPFWFRKELRQELYMRFMPAWALENTEAIENLLKGAAE